MGHREGTISGRKFKISILDVFSSRDLFDNQEEIGLELGGRDKGEGQELVAIGIDEIACG